MVIGAPRTLEERVRAWATHHCEEYRDEVGDVNLTALEEEAIVHFEISDDDFEDLDLSFAIWDELYSQQLI